MDFMCVFSWSGHNAGWQIRELLNSFIFVLFDSIVKIDYGWVKLTMDYNLVIT